METVDALEHGIRKMAGDHKLTLLPGSLAATVVAADPTQYAMSFSFGANKTLVTIHTNGSVQFHDGYTPDDAAQHFWAAMGVFRGDINANRAKMERLERENKRLRGILKECADGLEDAVNSQYGEMARRVMPDRYERDMQSVVKARAAIREESTKGEPPEQP